MNEKRFFYNPDNGKVYIFNYSHVQFFHNNRGKLQKNFDYYIRGILAGDKVYIRAYYPYSYGIYLSHKEIMQKSHDLLTIYRDEIKTALKNEYVKICDVKINVSNEDLKNILNTQYV